MRRVIVGLVVLFLLGVVSSGWVVAGHEPGPGQGWQVAAQDARHSPHAGKGARLRELQVIAEVLGMSQQDLISQLRAGATVADVAEGQGVNVNVLVEALTRKEAERLERAVRRGRLEAAEAEALLALRQAHVRRRLETPYRLPMLAVVAQVLGMEPPALVQALREGATVAALAEARGVALDTVITAVLAPRLVHWESLVAEGALTAAQKETLATMARERLARRFTRPWQERPLARQHRP